MTIENSPSHRWSPIIPIRKDSTENWVEALPVEGDTCILPVGQKAKMDISD
jgi:hypothetical protein